jgi:CheY-like chemotaxis protein
LSILGRATDEAIGVHVVINSAIENPTSTVDPAGVWTRSGENQPRSANVLVVEDDQGVRETTVAILREEGYVVVQAADGADALELLRGHDIDVLLLDLRLPRLDGASVLEALDQPPTVVVVSGFESFEESDMRRRFGSVLFDCLHKPVSPHRLMATTAAAADHALSTRDTDAPGRDETER